MTLAAAQTSHNEIIDLERRALERWGNGDPGGFLDLYASDISYFDPGTEARLDGHQTMTDYYRPFTGKIHIVRYDLVNPYCVIDGHMALLTYNLVNYILDEHGVEVVGTRWNSTVVYQYRGGAWKSIHSHWSFTRHPALNLNPVESEGLSA